MNRLEQLLEDSGMTRYELTKQMGIRPGSLDRYFNGKASMITMSYGNALKLSKILGIKMEEIWKMAPEEDKIEWKDGWHSIDGLDIFVEDGKVLRGIRNDRTVYPYIPSSEGGIDNASGIPLKEYLQRVRKGTVTWQ